ncbi:CDP-glycerol glycerophosphotransferase family protein [Kordiimonas sp. SCSIO 12603]|uniref:CDP-glycerol glycerophosphotransferase family protein n=1 Tax=Kordiimonas sp. SCSIO 12603 TaxID=2829596 RepID=UPI002104EC5E|nr:CDP-glycerol glycerophosphotransferase family protein [Kordiimonas sp. SCSIO 12603]UTW58951.1 CDP-glycerol glycerophosphotransferase family protein [Kordiimonas sp. SCSIO 12603]
MNKTILKLSTKNPIIKFIRFIFIIFIWGLFSPIRLFIPKRKNLYLFGNNKGSIDNSYYLMDYLSKNFPDLDCFWVNRNSMEIYSLRSIWLHLRASKVFIVNGKTDILIWLVGHAEIHNLWHGIPMRKIRLDDDMQHGLNKWFIALSDWLTPAFHYVNSEYERNIIKSAFFRQKAILETGSPRTDIILHQKAANIAETSTTPTDIKKVLYAPTWRPYDSPSPLMSVDDCEYINKVCQKNNLILYIRAHFLENISIESQARFPLIQICDNDNDVNTELDQYDILISDYSSIIFDYSLLDRPIFLYTPDIDLYSEKVGFYLDYKDFVEGNNYTNWKTLMKALSSLTNKKLLENNLVLSSKFKKLGHTFTDARNMKRIADFAIKGKL